jgi:hypothetical protein
LNSTAGARNFNNAYTPGGYHDRAGFTTSNIASLNTHKSSRMYIPNTLWTWSFFAVALFQTIVVLALEAYVFGEFESSLRGNATGKHPPDAAKTIPTYLAIFIFGFLYELYLVWDALRLKNTIQIIGICLYNLGLMIYAAVEIDQLDQAARQLGSDIDRNSWKYMHPCLIAAPCIIAFCTILLSLIAWKLYDEFAWTIYKHISADLRLKRRYLTYQVRPSSCAPWHARPC